MESDEIDEVIRGAIFFYPILNNEDERKAGAKPWAAS